MVYTPDATLKYRELERIWDTVNRETALQPTTESPGSPMKIVILSLRFELGEDRFRNGLFLEDDYDGRN